MPSSTEFLRFGQRVSVLTWACDPLWRTKRGLEIAGPGAFGYDIGYRPFHSVARPVETAAVQATMTTSTRPLPRRSPRQQEASCD